MRINEIFYSLQGEGRFTGTPAVFIRFSGCNLSCSFCDTSHEPFTEMSEDGILDAAASFPARHAVITGGEPALQLTASLVDKLHAAGFFVQIETNGTHPVPQEWGIDWVTCSPKVSNIALSRIDELKVVYHGAVHDMSCYDDCKAQVYSLQPCDTGSVERNRRILSDAIDFCLANPKWRLSLQTHKMINIR